MSGHVRVDGSICRVGLALVSIVAALLAVTFAISGGVLAVASSISSGAVQQQLARLLGIGAWVIIDAGSYRVGVDVDVHEATFEGIGRASAALSEPRGAQW